ncbi:MAG TPA: hypothetical protein VGP64_08015 [Polyangia bacterium]|jgi:hypothetical protein
MPKARAGVARALLAAGALMAITSGCAGPGDIRFDKDGCSIDGRPADLPRVEAREAAVQHRIASLQPWLVAITVAIVSLAGIGYAERLVMLFSARRDARGMGQRLQALVDRYRSHPVRYFALLVGSVGMLIAAGGLYIYCDADKRSSERALGALQFCHLALRTADEKGALDDQRQNLSSIHETAGAIRQLIDKLPPAEQAKASEIINHMDDAVGRERRAIAGRLQRSEENAVELSNRTESIERGLAGLATDVGVLKGVPGDLHALTDAVGRVDARAAAANDKLAATDDKLAAASDRLAAANAALVTLQRTVNAVAERPAPVCPACVCNDRPAAAPAARAPATVARKGDDSAGK